MEQIKAVYVKFTVKTHFDAIYFQFCDVNAENTTKLALYLRDTIAFFHEGVADRKSATSYLFVSKQCTSNFIPSKPMLISVNLIHLALEQIKACAATAKIM